MGQVSSGAQQSVFHPTLGLNTFPASHKLSLEQERETPLLPPRVVNQIIIPSASQLQLHIKQNLKLQ